MQTESLFLDIHLKETDNEDAAQVEIRYITIDLDNDLIDSIISIFKKIPDSHVILETIQPKKLYTGDRTREAV